jgi:hypothetical protein
MNKKIFTIDVSSVPAEEIDAYMAKMKNIKKTPYVSYEEMVRLGYYTPQKFTKWKRFKRWCTDVKETLAIALSFGPL